MFKRIPFYFKSLDSNILYFCCSLIGFFVIINFSIISLFQKNTETAEWISFFLIFIFFLLYFFYNKLYLNIVYNIFKLIFFSVFLFFFIYSYNFQYIHLLLIIVSIIILYFKYKKNLFNKFNNIILYEFLFFCIIIYFTTEIFYWSSLDDKVFYKVNEFSSYISLAPIIELIVPIVFFLSVIVFLFLLYKSQVNKFIISKKYLHYLSIFPIIVFFIESFSTYTFFSKYGGGSMYHWQAIVGPNEMMQQGGYLLWDTPSAYGYLTHIVIDIIPISDKWLSFYYLNGSMTFILALVLFYNFWYFKNFSFLIIASFLTYVVVFLLPTGASHSNIANTPATGAFRFFWIFILLFAFVYFRNVNFYQQFKYIYFIYIIGFLWSFESAFFVSSAILPFFVHHVFFQNDSLKKFFYFLTIPITFLVICLTVILYYQLSLSVFPDFVMFFETSIANQQGYFSNTITEYKSLIIHLIVISIFIFYSYKNKHDYIIFSIILGLWSISSYFVSQSDPGGLLKIFIFYVFAIFLILKLLSNEDAKNYIFYTYPIILILIVLNLSNPELLRHIKGTLLNQDYKLNNVESIEDTQLFDILNEINLDEKTPLFYIERSRYLNVLHNKKYFNLSSNKFINISNLITFPCHPPSSTIKYSTKRMDIYKNRWLDKFNTENIKYSYLILPLEEYYWSRKTRNVILDKNNYYIVKSIKKYDSLELFKIIYI